MFVLLALGFLLGGGNLAPHTSGILSCAKSSPCTVGRWLVRRTLQFEALRYTVCVEAPWDHITGRKILILIPLSGLIGHPQV